MATLTVTGVSKSKLTASKAIILLSSGINY